MLKLEKARFIGSDWVARLQPTKKEAKVLKDKAIPLGIILYIDEDFEKTTAYYQVGSKTVAVQVESISHYEAEKLMASYPDDFVHGYIKSDTIFPDEEVLIDTALLNYGLYVAVDETEVVDEVEDVDETEVVDEVEDVDETEDTSKDCRDVLGVHLNKEETSKDYSKTINVHWVPIKNCCISFKEAMLIHEAVEDNLIDFLGNLNLERWELFDSDVDCTLSLDEQYNNMVTGFIVFGAVLSIFTVDATCSKDIYLGYMKQSYNLRKWEVQELSNLIDIGINLNSSVIEPHSFTLLDCLKSFIRTVCCSVCFESHRFLDVEEVVEKLQKEDLFYKAAKFYLTMVCWGKFEPAPCINTVTITIDFGYPKIVRDYNNYLELFEQGDMLELLTNVAEEFHLDTELLEKCEAVDIIDKDIAIYILNKWDKYKKIKFHLIPYEVRTKLQVLYHVIRKIKGVH